MYSYQDRLRAVRLYIKLGKRIGLTIRQLGYPTKNALKTRHREYELVGVNYLGRRIDSCKLLPVLTCCLM